MKTIISITVSIFISLLGYSGGNSEKIHERFAKQEGVVAMSFSKEMMNAFDFDFDWNEALKQFTGDFKQAKLLILSSDNESMNSDVLEKELRKNGYKQVEMDDDDDIRVFVDKKRKEFSEIHLLSKGKDSGMLISVYGNFVITDK